MLPSRFRILASLLFALLLTLQFGCAAGGGDSEENSSNSTQISAPSSSSNQSSNSNPFARSFSFCGTEEPDSETMATLSSGFAGFTATGLARRSVYAAFSREPVSIPVHYHVISRGPSFDEGEVPDALLVEQVDVLNRAFSGEMGGVATPFRFHLGGINRVRNSEWHVMAPGSDSELDAKQALKVGGIDTLNIYLVDIQANAEDIGGEGEGIILGYTTLPVFASLLGPFDGIVLNFKAVPSGPINHYNLGHVAIHEVGHWLGLMHTFTGECTGFFDDLVLDTPREETPGSGDYCPTNRDSCPNLEGGDPIHNHMTYTADDCRSEFSQGQVDFMMFNSLLFRQMSTL